MHVPPSIRVSPLVGTHRGECAMILYDVGKKIKTFTYFLNKNLALTLYTYIQSLQKTRTGFGLNIRSYIV